MIKVDAAFAKAASAPAIKAKRDYPTKYLLSRKCNITCSGPMRKWILRDHPICIIKYRTEDYL